MADKTINEGSALTLSSFVPSRFTQVFFLDTEFQAPDGEQQTPVSLCAYELRGRRKFEMFFDRRHENIFINPDALFVGYNLVAEWKTFLALGWPIPRNSIDLYFEYLRMVNGVWRGAQSIRELGTGLIDAMREHGLDPMDAAEKTGERDYILANGVVPPEGVSPEAHARRILDYCWLDVRGTHKLASRMLSNIDFDQALWRGRYTEPAAHFEHNGLPVHAQRYNDIRDRREELQIELAEKVERKNSYGVYKIQKTKGKLHPVFKMQKFEELLERRGLLAGWPKTDTGKPATDDDEVFAPMARLHPFLEDLRQTRKSLNDLGRFGSHVGADGFNRAPLFAFGTVSSRNNPKARAFLLSRPHWVRNLITPREGMAIVHADVVGAESWLAAGFSGDPELMRIYQSGADQYIEFATASGALTSGTKRDKSNPELERIRAVYKTSLLAINYGVKEKTLSLYVGLKEWQAARIINSHKETYAVYWQWAIDQVERAEKRGHVETDFGWRLDTRHAPFNTVLNFPQQSACAEVLRAACIFMCDRGWGSHLSAPHHDAIYMHVPVEDAERAAQDLRECFVEAGELVMGEVRMPDGTVVDFPLRVDTDIEPYPGHYNDPDGEALWKIAAEFFNWEGEFDAKRTLADSSQTRNVASTVLGEDQAGAVDCPRTGPQEVAACGLSG